MSRNSQTAAQPDVAVVPTPTSADLDVPRAIVTVSVDHRRAGTTRRHTHPHCQLLYAAHGTLTTAAREGSWVAPPQRAIWIPARVPHVTRHSVGTELRSIFVREGAMPGLPARCAIIQLRPLLRELCLAVMRLPRLYDERGADGRLVRVLLDRLVALPEEPLHLPMPADRGLRHCGAFRTAS